MTTIHRRGEAIETCGELPPIGSQAYDFIATNADLEDFHLHHFNKSNIILNIFPSIDTPTCAQSVRKFNELANGLTDTVVLCLSADLPFAQKRFCGAENLANVIPLSTFRYPEFGQLYGVTITTGILAGLFSRAIVVIDKDNKIIYTEQVQDIGNEPNYNQAISALQ